LHPAREVLANLRRVKNVSDPAAKVVILEDGKMYRMVPNTVVIVEEKPVTFETLRPGASVVIRSGEVVEFKDGKYIVITPSASPR
jgi:hypothetical protein